MKERSRNWKKPEIQFLIKSKVEMKATFNKAIVKHETLWENISEKMKERGYGRSAETCVRKWRNLVRESKNPRANEPLRDVYEEIEKLLNAQPGRRTVRRRAANIDRAATISEEPQCMGNKEDKHGITERKENKHISLPSYLPREPVLGEAKSESHETRGVGNQEDGVIRSLFNCSNDFISFPLDEQPDLSIDDIPTAEFSFGDNDDAFLALLSPYQKM